MTVAELAKKRDIVWRTTKLAEGAKGPVVADVACMRVIQSREHTPMGECWLFIRKYPDGELKYAFSNAPKETPFEELVRASIMRWPIEQCFQEGKEQLGMDHYEHRSWTGWHRHMLFVFMAQLFVWKMRDRYKKNSELDVASGTVADRSSVTGRPHDQGTSTRNRAVLHQTKSYRI
jgi:SRSO17 transposase